jgi:hypothetical protein
MSKNKLRPAAAHYPSRYQPAHLQRNPETRMKLIDPIVQFQAEIQQIRRDIHAHPELCYEEHRTADVITRQLQQWGIPVVSGLGGTGVLGIIKNGNSKRAIGLRADMDALPMQEINSFPHRSQHEGKCMPAAMTGIPRCCWVPRIIWRNTAISMARYI